MCGFELGTKEIEGLLENLINQKQQQFLCSGAVVDSRRWNDEIACGHATCGKKDSIRSGILPDKMVLVDDNQVGTSQGRVNKGGTTLERQGSRQ